MSSQSNRQRPFQMLGKDFIAYGVMGALSKASGLLLLPFLTRNFTPDQYGALEIILTLVAFLAITIGLTLESAVMRFWIVQMGKGKEGLLIFSVLVLIFIQGVFIIIGTWFFSGNLSMLLFDEPMYKDLVLLGSIIAFLQAVSSIPQVILRMQRRIVFYNSLLLIQTFLYISLTLFFILKLNKGIDGALVAMAISQFIILSVGGWAIKSHLEFRFNFSLLKDSLSYSLPLLPAVFVTLINQQADRIILLAFMGLGFVGIFGVAGKVAMIVGLVVMTFQKAWSPLALSVIDQPLVRNDFYRRGLNYYAGAMAILGLTLTTFSGDLFEFLVPDEYMSGYVVIPWVVGALILHGSGRITNLGMLITKRTYGNSVAAWTGAIANIAIGLILIPYIGIWGAAIGSFIAELIFTTILLRYTTRLSEVRFDTIKIVWVLLAYIIYSISLIIVFEFINNPVFSIFLRVGLLITGCIIIIRLVVDDGLKRKTEELRRLFYKIFA